MSALANAGWETDCDGASADPARYTAGVIPMSERLAALCDTLAVLALLLVFRTAMVLRSWNY